MSRRLTAIVEREGDGYIALCPEVDVASLPAPLPAMPGMVPAAELTPETRAVLATFETDLARDVFVALLSPYRSGVTPGFTL